MKNVSNNKGFSLVELAIAITVIGLLIGLVVGAAGMMKNAHVSSTVTQFAEIDRGIAAFRKTYMSWPGDFPRATNSLFNCGALTGCGNGNGNGAIGSVASDPEWDVSWAADAETSQAWKHLILSENLSGLAPAPSGFGWGETHPRADIGGGFEIFYDPDHSVDNRGGHFLRITGFISGSDLVEGQGVDVYGAKNVDIKLDDGLPLEGRVTAQSTPEGACVDGSDYTDVNSVFNTQDCALFIHIK